jgi:hypothetical protein
MARILEIFRKALHSKVPYTVSGNGVVHVKASDILKTPEAKEQIRAAKTIVSRR